MVSIFFLIATFLFGVWLAKVFDSQRQKLRQHVTQLQPRQRGFTRAEIAKHNTAEDLWVIIKPRDCSEYRVYDLTSYVDEHPGGDGILNHAGGDSTEGFHGKQHPPRAFEIIDDFYIGNLIE